MFEAPCHRGSVKPDTVSKPRRTRRTKMYSFFPYERNELRTPIRFSKSRTLVRKSRRSAIQSASDFQSEVQTGVQARLQQVQRAAFTLRTFFSRMSLNTQPVSGKIALGLRYQFSCCLNRPPLCLFRSVWDPLSVKTCIDVRKRTVGTARGL